MSNVYHLKPPNMSDTILRPLNRLRDVAPDAYEKAISKYNDHPSRKDIPTRKIPLLGCNWADVVQFCPVHPENLKKVMSTMGMTVPRLEFIVIPAERIRDLPSVVYYGMQHEPRYNITDWSTIENLNSVPPETMAWYKHLAEHHMTGGFFHGIPHVMIKGEVDITGCDSMMIGAESTDVLAP